MIIITKDNISNYLTDHDINIIDTNINKKMYFIGLNELIKDNKDNNCKIIYNHKYYFISYNYNNYNDTIIIINNDNYNDIKIYIKYINTGWDIFNIIKNIDINFYCYYINRKIINYNKNKIIEYNYNYNYKLIKIDTKIKKIFLNYYYIYYNCNNYYNNYTSLYYYNNYFLFILKIYKNRYYIKIKSNLNNNINNLLFFV